MSEVYVDGWGRITVEIDDPGVGFENAYEAADAWLDRSGYNEYCGKITLIPCGINKFREAD